MCCFGMWNDCQCDWWIHHKWLIKRCWTHWKSTKPCHSWCCCCECGCGWGCGWMCAMSVRVSVWRGWFMSMSCDHVKGTQDTNNHNTWSSSLCVWCHVLFGVAANGASWWVMYLYPPQSSVSVIMIRDSSEHETHWSLCVDGVMLMLMLMLSHLSHPLLSWCPRVLASKSFKYHRSMKGCCRVTDEPSWTIVNCQYLMLE